MQAIDLAAKFALFSDHWQPRLVAEMNGQEIRIAKLLGEFCWHAHADADELFLVVRGRLRIDFRAHAVELAPGQLLVVPRGVEHRPVATEEVEVLLFEPAGTKSGGDTDDPRSVTKPERI